MIPQLQSPSICVIDDEKSDYEPLLNALLRLGLGCVHVKGDSKASLPHKPFLGLRVVFMDLHLSGLVGKDAASHAANVFARVVSVGTAPMIVIIWSKYKNDVPGGGDEPTEADLFKKTLLETFPNFDERLVFLEMAKPKLENRPVTAKWVTKLKAEVKKTLEKVPAFGALWGWEALVREAGDNVAAGLTNLAMQPEPNSLEAGENNSRLPERLMLAMRILVHEQGGANCTAKSAPRHLATVLGQSLVDHFECLGDRNALAQYGQWLADHSGLPRKLSAIGPGVNAFLLTSPCSEVGQPFMPGNIYRPSGNGRFEGMFGMTVDDVLRSLYNGTASAFDGWKKANPALPILIELSPACDVHQGHRKNALLVGGFILPATARPHVKRADSIELLPTFSLRWAADGFQNQPVFLAFLSRLKATMRATKQPKWLEPWFRLRELPTASLRNWHAAHASRVGYTSVL